MSVIEMKVPTVGESITEVTVASWNKKDGDFVKMDEILCELESDKATFELPAEAEGILRIIAYENETLPIGALICKIESSNEPISEIKKEDISADSPQPKAESQSILEIKIPAVGESITEVTIASWNKKEGDAVKMDETLCELESDKATFELPAEATGTLHIVVQAGQTIGIGTVVATISVGASAAVASKLITDATPQFAMASANIPQSENYASGTPSPAAAKILAEKGVDATSVLGTGVGGRITKEDAQKTVVSNEPTATSPKPEVIATQSEVRNPQSTIRNQRREKMTTLRKVVARRLVQVKNETAMLTTFNEVDMKPIMDIRAKYKDKFKEKHGIGLGFMSFFTKAVCVALKEFPSVNAQIDGEQIVFNDFADISIAVSAPKGLVVPVIRNAEQLSLAGIEAEVMRLALKARDNKLTLEEMSGGTFTITNGGVFGSMLSTPIINAPQVAILGMHNIVERAVVIDGQIVVRPIMYVALSYDHRIIDGKESVSFLVRVKQLLEDPTRLLLDV